MGFDLYPVVLSIGEWGDKYLADEKGPPVTRTHKSCGHEFHTVHTCSECGDPLLATDVRAQRREG